jgi:hypothetical protein
MLVSQLKTLVILGINHGVFAISVVAWAFGQRQASRPTFW